MITENTKKRRSIVNKKNFKRTIILLEHEGHVKNCLEWFQDIKVKKRMIALSPFARYELDKHNFSYSIPEDYYDDREASRMGISNYQKVENLCRLIDKKIHNSCPSLANLSIRPAMFNFSQLKALYDIITLRLFQLSKLIDAEKPDIILTYADKEYPLWPPENAILGFDNRESIYTKLLELNEWEIPVKILPYVVHPEDSNISKPHLDISKLRNKVLWWVSRHPRLFDLVMETHKFGWREAFGILKNHLHANKSTQVLLFGQGFEWDYCRKELESIGIDPIFNRMRDGLMNYYSGRLDECLTKIWKELRVNGKFREFFIWNKIDFFPVMEKRLQFLVERSPQVCLNAYKIAERIIKKRKVKIFISQSLESCAAYSAAQAAKNHNIPVVTWQHGEYGARDDPLYLYMMSMGSDIHFVYGEGVVCRYKKAAERVGTQLIAVGSPSLEALHQMLRQNNIKKVVKLTQGKVVLYVLASFRQNGLYLLGSPPFSDNRYWYTQRAILNVLGKHKDYGIIVKIHPSRSREPPVRVYVKENGFNNFQFIRHECSFIDLLPVADLIVVDLPSTTLLQALVTSKPIFVFTGHYYLDREIKRLLERRTFCYDDLKEFVNALDNYLYGKIDRQVNLNDKEFLKAYGISSQEYGSGIRAAKKLKDIMGRVE